jgi:DNA-binding NtrC family response regulator
MAQILIVDDKPGVRRLIAEELAFRGYTVIALGDTKSSAVAEEVRRTKLDLVLLDVYKKGELRRDLIEEIKRQDPFLPILAVTGFDNYRGDSRLEKVEGISIRNFEFDELLQTVAEILRKKQGNSDYRKIQRPLFSLETGNR